MISHQKHHFTELSLMVEIVSTSLANLSVRFNKPQLNPEQDIFSAQLHPLNLQNQQQYTLKIIQIHHILTFILIQTHTQTHIVESFWLDYRKHLPKKINSTYLLADLEKQKKQSIESVIVKRVGKYLMKQKCGLSQRLLAGLQNNLIRISEYIGVRDLKNVMICHPQIYKVLHCERNFKNLYQWRWGKTGFELDERDWIKSYRVQILKNNNKK